MIGTGELCFWHPVGAHADEELRAILERKQREVAAYGFTLWSFRRASTDRVNLWRTELHRAGQKTCIVVGCGDRTADPYRQSSIITWASKWSKDGTTWFALPSSRMTSCPAAPARDGILGSAFFVTAVVPNPQVRVARPTCWLHLDGSHWNDAEPLPTRGEYLVRRLCETSRGKRVRVMLETAEPFVVWIA